MPKTKSKRGFAAMSAEQARSIQAAGGKASPMKFSKNDKRAVEAGRKGGKISRKGK